MKILVVPLLVCGLCTSDLKDANDFDSDLDRIVRDLKTNIMDVEKCKEAEGDADEVADDIDDALEDDPNNSELKNLKEEAEALSEYIGGVILSTTGMPTITDFNLANKRVGATVTSATPKDACVDVVKITIGEFVSYMFQNNTTSNYTVTYKWKATSGMGSGSGEMGLWNKTMRQIYTNHDKPAQKTISVYGITCKLIVTPGY